MVKIICCMGPFMFPAHLLYLRCALLSLFIFFIFLHAKIQKKMWYQIKVTFYSIAMTI
jgi:hypothetical protein